jgi:hypothetical protein
MAVETPDTCKMSLWLTTEWRHQYRTANYIQSWWHKQLSVTLTARQHIQRKEITFVTGNSKILPGHIHTIRWFRAGWKDKYKFWTPTQAPKHRKNCERDKLLGSNNNVHFRDAVWPHQHDHHHDHTTRSLNSVPRFVARWKIATNTDSFVTEFKHNYNTIHLHVIFKDHIPKITDMFDKTLWNVSGTFFPYCKYDYLEKALWRFIQRL